MVGLVGIGGPMAVPMWRQIADDLRAKIESGELDSDQLLPTEVELQARYSASRNTVRDAVKWLVNRGLVVTRSGQGTFVSPEVDKFITDLRSDVPNGGPDRTPKAAVTRVESLVATGIAATELELDPGTSVIRRYQQRTIGEQPYSLQTTFYPLDYVPRGAAKLLEAVDIEGGAVRYLEKTLRIKEAGWRDRIRVRLPNADEVEFFDLPDDGRIDVFEIIRTGFDQLKRPIRVTVTTLPAYRNEFVMHQGDVPAILGVHAQGLEERKSPQ
jgi:GntR family transcriptional regulator